MSALTQDLAELVAESPNVVLPREAVAIAKKGFVDTIATMLAGRRENVVLSLCRLHAEQETGNSSVLMGLARADAQNAVLINSASAHALDFDDVALLGHPSAVLVPAVLAEADRLGRSGSEAIGAYVSGYQVWAELCWRESDPLHAKGWHPTSIFGTIGAAAATATLHGFDAETARNALAIAASFSSGLAANFGSMAKPLQVGMAASRGVYAARLAGAGMTGSEDALEHYAGLLAAISPRGNTDRISPIRPREAFWISELGLSIKKYPICYATHRAIDGLIELTRANDITGDEVGQVCIIFSPTQAALLRNHRPKTALEAAFSIEFAAAAAITNRRVGFEQMTDSYVARADIQGMIEKVKIEMIDTHSPNETGLALTERVIVRMKDGREFDSGEIRFARGNAQLPLSDEELSQKFRMCTQGVDWIDPVALLDKLQNLENLRTTTDLVN
jgi:2-methylcitrate dehydratase PrpD